MGSKTLVSLAAGIAALFLAASLSPAFGQAPAAAPQAVSASDPLEQALLRGIEKTVGDAPLVAFGECSHFLLKLHEFSNTLFRYLVEQKGFRVFMVESAWAANDYLTEFIKTDKTDIEGWMSFYLNAFDSPPTRQTLLYIRDFNKKHAGDPIQIAGMQPEQPWTDYRELNATLAAASLKLPDDIRALIDRAVFGGKTFAHDIDVIGFHGGMSRQKQRILSDADLASLKAALDGIDRFLAANAAAITRAASKTAFEEAKLRVLGLRFYALSVLPSRDFGLIQKKPTDAQVEKLTRDIYNAGDAFRFQIIKTQRETRFKGKKIMIWMHMWHAAKRSETIECTIAGQPPAGTTSLGTHLFREYGPSYQVVASVVADPNFAYKEGVVTIDNAFNKLFGDKPAYVDILHLTPDQKSLPLGVKLPWLSQVDNMYGGGIVLKDQFDGIVYFPKSELTFGRKK